MFPDPKSRSAKLTQRAMQVLPDGGSRSTIRMTPHAIYVKEGHGGRVTDVDGNTLLDFNNNFTSLIHGHAHPRVVEAIQKQAPLGTAFSFATEAEIELAEMLTARVEGFDMIRFCNSGSEAVMNAIKAARAFTGRPRIAKCEGAYHGSYDFAEVSLGSGPDHWGDETRPESVPYSHGTPGGVLSDVIVIPFNDVARAEAILDAHADELAGVVFDPVSTQIGLLPPSPEFLDMLVRFRERSGALLIFDEVIAFRQGHGGSQTLLGVTPDLTALGKIIGGGLPVGAVAGSREVMSVFEVSGAKARLPHGGTFNANPLTIVAGRAAMTDWTPEAVDNLNAKGEQCREALREAIRIANVPGQVTGSGSLFRIHVHGRQMTTYRDTYPTAAEAERTHALAHGLIGEGVFTSTYGLGCLSTSTSDADVARLADATVTVYRAMREKGLYDAD
ncbi:MAG: aspartate aminotransferase family protein [Minwuia sp.]|uniref:aspartate aminotransferase family protein n=1 Tax=Minwuia sp. TaxID=2493630 RepID=UPI003A8749A3